MSNESQNWIFPLGGWEDENTYRLEQIRLASNFFPLKTNIFDAISDELDIDNLANHSFADVVAYLSKWDKKVEKILHGLDPEENIENGDKKSYLQKHGIHDMIQRACRDMDDLVGSLFDLKNAVEDAEYEFENDTKNNNNNNNNNNNSNNNNNNDNDNNGFNFNNNPGNNTYEIASSDSDSNVNFNSDVEDSNF